MTAKTNNQPRLNLVAAPVLARWLGVTDKTVRELAQVGVAVRIGRGFYKLEESVTRYCEQIRRTASQRGGEASLATLRDERIRIHPRAGGRIGVQERGGARRAARCRRRRARVVGHPALCSGWYACGAIAGRRTAAASDTARRCRDRHRGAGRID